MAALVEPSGLGPFEGARIEIDAHGNVQVISGCSSQGQGHETVLAQVAAEVLRVPIERITVRHGDTGLIPFGGGSYASRTAVMSGHAVYAAALAVKEKAIRTAAAEAGSAPSTTCGWSTAASSSSARRASTFDARRGRAPADARQSRDARAADRGEHRRPRRARSTELSSAPCPSGTSVFAVHLAEVAVDLDTGQIRVERYLVAADVGRAINPLIVEGQLVGGVVQGLGGTLLEEIAYTAEGDSCRPARSPTICCRRCNEAPPIQAIVHREGASRRPIRSASRASARSALRASPRRSAMRWRMRSDAGAHQHACRSASPRILFAGESEAG